MLSWPIFTAVQFVVSYSKIFRLWPSAQLARRVGQARSKSLRLRWRYEPYIFGMLRLCTGNEHTGTLTALRTGTN